MSFLSPELCKFSYASTGGPSVFSVTYEPAEGPFCLFCHLRAAEGPLVFSVTYELRRVLCSFLSHARCGGSFLYFLSHALYRVLVAARDLKAGETVLKEAALTSGPGKRSQLTNRRSGNRCSANLRERTGFQPIREKGQMFSQWERRDRCSANEREGTDF